MGRSHITESIFLQFLRKVSVAYLLRFFAECLVKVDAVVSVKLVHNSILVVASTFKNSAIAL